LWRPLATPSPVRWFVNYGGSLESCSKMFLKEESEAVYVQRKISFQRPEKSGIPELDLI